MRCIPQRLHRTCVLLWRLPKLDVPFAIQPVSLPDVLLDIRCSGPYAYSLCRCWARVTGRVRRNRRRWWKVFKACLSTCALRLCSAVEKSSRSGCAKRESAARQDLECLRVFHLHHPKLHQGERGECASHFTLLFACGTFEYCSKHKSLCDLIRLKFAHATEHMCKVTHLSLRTHCLRYRGELFKVQDPYCAIASIRHVHLYTTH